MWEFMEWALRWTGHWHSMEKEKTINRISHHLIKYLNSSWPFTVYIVIHSGDVLLFIDSFALISDVNTLKWATVWRHIMDFTTSANTIETLSPHIITFGCCVVELLLWMWKEYPLLYCTSVAPMLVKCCPCKWCKTSHNGAQLCLLLYKSFQQYFHLHSFRESHNELHNAKKHNWNSWWVGRKCSPLRQILANHEYWLMIR